MSDQNEKPRDLEPIEDRREIDKYLAEGAKAAASTLIWLKDDQDNVIQSHITLFNALDRALYFKMPENFDYPQFVDQLTKRKLEDCLFSASLPSANLFFKARLLDFDATLGLKFEIPGKAYKVQRRRETRYQIPMGYALPVEFDHPKISRETLRKKIIDISAGGLSFLTDTDEAELYTAGEILKNLKVTVRAKLIQTDGEIRHTKQISEKSLKIGIAFKTISAPDSSLIASYVFDESRKFLSRFI